MQSIVLSEVYLLVQQQCSQVRDRMVKRKVHSRRIISRIFSARTSIKTILIARKMLQFQVDSMIELEVINRQEQIRYIKTTRMLPTQRRSARRSMPKAVSRQSQRMVLPIHSRCRLLTGTTRASAKAVALHLRTIHPQHGIELTCPSRLRTRTRQRLLTLMMQRLIWQLLAKVVLLRRISRQIPKSLEVRSRISRATEKHRVT